MILGVSLVLGACGGGGGTTVTAAYIGNRAPADITVANGETLASGGLGGSQSVGGLANATGRPQGEASGSLILGPIDAITHLVNRSLEKTATRATSQARTVSDTLGCSSGGSAYLSFDIPDGGDDFYGYMDFNGCGETGVLIDGRVDIRGAFAGDVIDGMKLTIRSESPLVVAGSGSSVTLTGTLAMQFDASSTYIDTTLLVENSDGSIEMLENFTLEYSDGPVWAHTLHISGRYYHPVEGYVEIRTTNSLALNPTDIWPFWGSLLLTGAHGSIAQIDIINNAQYTLSIDEDGDGNWESSEVVNF
ncbi:MAG: hypothetical protein DIZ78_08720 [endosymbiont of Escarpia spicata]|uniref:Uncharacterized protein n=1 Tax=endosymbiont of Escarpia spicata TaxID=2200908 RepID=A0A370DMV6_9GAMM|nr:MAG: hypothetical protein DIZ78_08720 [endosymbiont of Escarpia spicata]